MMRRPPRSTLFPTRRSSDLLAFFAPRLDLVPEGPGGHEAVLQVAAEVVQDVGPAVALVLHEALQQAQGDGLAVGSLVLDGPRERRGVLEADLLGEVASDLQVGVGSSLQAPVRLQDEP